MNLGPADGAVLARLPVTDGAADIQVGATGAMTLVHAGGRLGALDGASGATVWDTPAVGLPAPAVTDAKDARSPATLTVPEDGAFVQRDPAGGAELGRSAVPDAPDGGVAARIAPRDASQLTQYSLPSGSCMTT